MRQTRFGVFVRLDQDIDTPIGLKVVLAKGDDLCIVLLDLSKPAAASSKDPVLH
jgi:hypothetical protein